MCCQASGYMAALAATTACETRRRSEPLMTTLLSMSNAAKSETTA